MGNIIIQRFYFYIFNSFEELLIMLKLMTLSSYNSKELDVWKNENTKSYFLIVSILNYSGDISIINSSRNDDSTLLLRDNKTNEFLLELKDSIISFLRKFSF